LANKYTSDASQNRKNKPRTEKKNLKKYGKIKTTFITYFSRRTKKNRFQKNQNRFVDLQDVVYNKMMFSLHIPHSVEQQARKKDEKSKERT
jgi:hypothetical protein